MSIIIVITAQTAAKQIVNQMRSEFGKTLDILDCALLVDARDPHAEKMSEVRRMLKIGRDEIIVSDRSDLILIYDFFHAVVTLLVDQS